MNRIYDWATARRLAAEGYTAAQIGKVIDCNVSVVWYWAKRNGVMLKKHIWHVSPKLSKDDVTQAVLRDAFDYAPDTGLLTHKHNTRRVRRGGVVGHLDTRVPSLPRWTMRFRGNSFIVSRVIWMWVHGTWPSGQIDHINGDSSDNRLCNLRDVPASVNNQNKRRATVRNKAGLLGVSVHHDGAKPFLARIHEPRTHKVIRLGYFATAEAAHEAYVQAKRLLHPGCTL